MAQQHLRQILAAQGVGVMGGEAYIQFRPGLLDAEAAITDDGIRALLSAFMAQFAALVARLSTAPEAARAVA